MATPRYWHTATLLNNGKVLITGGVGPGSSQNPADLSSAELYDPSNGTFSAAGNMTAARSLHLAVALTDGRVLIEGGGGDGAPNPELYDPGSAAFSLTGASSQPSDLTAMTATLLPNGTVYTTLNVPDDSGNGAENYNSATGMFAPATVLPEVMYGDTATLLPEAQVFFHDEENEDSAGSQCTSPAARSCSMTRRLPRLCLLQARSRKATNRILRHCFPTERC